MYPRSGFRSGGTSECTLVPVFVPGEQPPKPPFWKPPFCQPQTRARERREQRLILKESSFPSIAVAQPAAFRNHRLGLQSSPTQWLALKVVTAMLPGLL